MNLPFTIANGQPADGNKVMANFSALKAAVEALGLPVITSSLTASGTVGTAFTYQIIANGLPTVFSATGLPDGLSIDTATGIISGTPTTDAVTNVTIGATNTTGTGTATLVLTVAVAPTGTPTPAAYTKLLMHFDSDFSDDAGHTFTNNGVIIDTTSKVFGAGSAFFDDGLGHSLIAPYSSDFDFGSGDFTVDFRIMFTGLVGGYHCTIGNCEMGNWGWWIEFQDANQMHFNYSVYGSEGLFVAASFSFSLSQFYHIKVSCVSGVVYLFIDGVCLNPGGTALEGAIYNPGLPLWIGVLSPSGGVYEIRGWLDEVRILKGLGDATADFTPPTTPYVIV